VPRLVERHRALPVGIGATSALVGLAVRRDIRAEVRVGQFVVARFVHPAERDAQPAQERDGLLLLVSAEVLREELVMPGFVLRDAVANFAQHRVRAVIAHRRVERAGA